MPKGDTAPLLCNIMIGEVAPEPNKVETAPDPKCRGEPAVEESPNIDREVFLTWERGSKPCATARSKFACLNASRACISFSAIHCCLYTWYSSLDSSYIAA